MSKVNISAGRETIKSYVGGSKQQEQAHLHHPRISEAIRMEQARGRNIPR